MGDGGLTDKDIQQLLKDIKTVKDMIKALEAVGAQVPGPLKTALNRLEMAIKAGKEVAEAAQEASDALRAFEADLYQACKGIDDEMQGVCEAEVARKWQVRAVSFTLDPKNKDSTTSNVINRIIKKATPDRICKNWDRCAKLGKK
jgi:hypothetical protein